MNIKEFNKDGYSLIVESKSNYTYEEYYKRGESGEMKPVLPPIAEQIYNGDKSGKISVKDVDGNIVESHTTGAKSTIESSGTVSVSGSADFVITIDSDTTYDISISIDDFEDTITVTGSHTETISFGSVGQYTFKIALDNPEVRYAETKIEVTN